MADQPLGPEDEDELSPESPEFCVACGDRIKIQIFKGTDGCCTLCHKYLRGELSDTELEDALNP